MPVAILVGDFGTGKTTLLKNNFLKSKRKKRIFAIEKNDFDLKVETDFEKLISETPKLRDTIFVVDEARVCIPRQEPQPTKHEHDKLLIEWFLNARKYNNFIFIVFHGLGEIPIWLITYTDFFIRFRTNDLMQYQRNRFMSFPAIVRSLDTEVITENFVYDEIKIR